MYLHGRTQRFQQRSAEMRTSGEHSFGPRCPIHRTGKWRSTVICKYIHRVKWLYLIHAMLYCYGSCINLSLIHDNLHECAQVHPRWGVWHSVIKSVATVVSNRCWK